MKFGAFDTNLGVNYVRKGISKLYIAINVFHPPLVGSMKHHMKRTSHALHVKNLTSYMIVVNSSQICSTGLTNGF